MKPLKYGDLRRARQRVISESERRFTAKSYDTTGPSIEAGLVVVNFDVEGALVFARELVTVNENRIARAYENNYADGLFAAAISTGLIYGSEAEVRRR